MRRKLLVLGAIGIAIGVTVFGLIEFKPTANTDVLNVSGNIEITDVEVSFTRPGWVEFRPAHEGQMIRRGNAVAGVQTFSENTGVTQTIENRRIAIPM